MRGKPNPGCHDARGFRIIPAHAGQTSSPDLNWASTTDHPRACGANFRRSPIARSTAGSSPRMRGKRLRGQDPRHTVRIIPAHAGQTKPSSNAQQTTADHPRACGANVLTLHLHHAASGSSPRMRGKLTLTSSMVMLMRIIPAHAGQTDPWCIHRRCSPDHPRACGANISLMTGMSIRNGSSPRMRGKLHGEFELEGRRRIIPAHAGQTRFVVL